MGKVTISEGDLQNGMWADANILRALFQRLASGLNSIDSSQLATGAVSTAAVGDAQVSLAKLKGGEFAYYDFFSKKEDGSTPAGDALYFDDAGGENHTTEFDHNTFKPLRTASYEAFLTIAPPQDCLAIFLGQLFVTVSSVTGGSDADKRYTRQMVGALWNETAGAVTDPNNFVARAYTPESLKVDASQVYAIPLLGMAYLLSGQSYKIVPAMRWNGAQTGTHAHATLSTSKHDTFLGAILLPK